MLAVRNGRNCLLLAVLCLVFVIFPISAQATDYYVNAGTGDNGHGGLSSGNAWKTITSALSQVSGTGHTINVAAGTYDTALGETFPLNMRNLVSLQGDGASTTIIDAVGANKTVIRAASIASPTIFDGFTIKNGNNTGYWGGGFFCTGSTWTVSNCIITNNHSANYGGGISCESNDFSKFTNCTITYNSSWDGGAVQCYYGDPTFTNCIISNNSAIGGAALYLYSGTPVLINCTITDNAATVTGGAMYAQSSEGFFTNCTIAGNSAPQGSAFTLVHSANTEVVNSIIWGNTGAAYEIENGSTNVQFYYQIAKIHYSDFSGSTSPLVTITSELNNINDDPLFVGSGDYHLSDGSPCIDEGIDTGYPNIPSDDIDGDSRPQGLGYDIGSDEYVVGEEPEPPCVDIDGDGYGVTPYFGIANGCIYEAEDCDDTYDTIYPGAAEITCNGIDENCNGMADDDPVDSDGDGTFDCIDGCPDDPDKTAPGTCGCGVPDSATDSDGDSTPDCIDGCPNDPNKTEPGVCGCGVADTDSDSDETPDCIDAFPSDPNEWLDTDGDGTGNNADLDDDDDDLPDAWELLYGLKPLDATGGNGKDGDPDKDSLTNYEEYLDSTDPNNAHIPAHRVTSYGVDRSDGLYSVGDCAHCHETFNPSTCGTYPLMFFSPVNPQSQSDNFCFQCHKGSGSVQEGGIVNASFSKTFGGAATADFTNVYDAFNAHAFGGSSHDLATLLSWAVTNHPEWGFTSTSNPCTLCHNPHVDQRNRFYPQDPTYTAIRRPSQHASAPGNKWGDDVGERMNANWSAYQAPYYQGGNYEPGGTTSTDGSKHPDYATLCLDCHAEIAVGPRSGIDWKNDTNVPRPAKTWGPIHGEFAYNFALSGTTDSLGYLNPPWSASDYVLSCLDCHESHGSSNGYLLRTTVNAVSGLTYDRDDNESVQTWCEACHTLTPEVENPLYCGEATLCHGEMEKPIHFNKAPYCVNCHKHNPDTICTLVHGNCP